MTNKEINQFIEQHQEKITKKQSHKIDLETLFIVMPVMIILMFIFVTIGLQVVFVYRSIIKLAVNFIFVMFIYYHFYKIVYLERFMETLSLPNKSDLIKNWFKNNYLSVMIFLIIVIIINIVISII